MGDILRRSGVYLCAIGLETGVKSGDSTPPATFLCDLYNKRFVVFLQLLGANGEEEILEWKEQHFLGFGNALLERSFLHATCCSL